MNEWVEESTKHHERSSSHNKVLMRSFNIARWSLSANLHNNGNWILLPILLLMQFAYFDTSLHLTLLDYLCHLIFKTIEIESLDSKMHPQRSIQISWVLIFLFFLWCNLHTLTILLTWLYYLIITYGPCFHTRTENTLRIGNIIKMNEIFIGFAPWSLISFYKQCHSHLLQRF